MLKSKPKQPMLFTVMVIYYLGMTVVFFLTTSPYSALHSGRVGPEVAVYCKEFVISPAYIILGAELLSVLFVIVRMKPILPSVWVVLLLSLAMVSSGIVNGAIYAYTSTYLYNAMTILGACMLATYDSNNTCLTDTHVRLFGWVWGALSLAGFGLTLAFPYRYGYLPFEFSRNSRGEITYWLVLCLHLLMPTACLLAFYARLSERWLLALFSVFVTIVSLSTVTRSVSIVTLSPYVLMALGLTFRVRDMALKFILALIAFSVGSVIFIAAVTSAGTASYEDCQSMEATLDQRFELWQFHWDNFVQDPLFGAGAFSLTRKSTTILDSQATSEIGALTWFSEYGMLSGTIVMYVMMTALYQCMKILIRRDLWEIGELFFAVVFASLFVIFLVEGLGRILDLTSFLFWYSMFYLNAGGRSKVRIESRQ